MPASILTIERLDDGPGVIVVTTDNCPLTGKVFVRLRARRKRVQWEQEQLPATDSAGCSVCCSAVMLSEVAAPLLAPQSPPTAVLTTLTGRS